MIFSRQTFVHLRIIFSLFLLPVFLFAVSQAERIYTGPAILIFILLHFFIYPASNAYNSYMDQDEGSIGGIKSPVKATRDVYYASILLDLSALLIAVFIDLRLALLLTVYIGVSKAYSWRKTRLKRFAVIGWLVVVIFQGGYTYMMVSMVVQNNISSGWFTLKETLAFLFATLMIGGFYPLTQIYQHEEDNRRGDLTISSRLGVRNTFIFSGVNFIIAMTLAWFYFTKYFTPAHFAVIILSMLPATIYFISWAKKSFADETAASFENTMRMTYLSSICVATGYIILWIMNRPPLLI